MYWICRGSINFCVVYNTWTAFERRIFVLQRTVWSWTVLNIFHLSGVFCSKLCSMKWDRRLPLEKRYNSRNSRLQCTSVSSLAKRDNVTVLCNFKQQLRDLFCWLYRKDTAVIDNILRAYALERKIFGFIILMYEPELYYDKWNVQENHS